MKQAPQGENIESKTVKAPKDEIYDNIWNIINPNDVVPKVAMSKFGFTRFGRDVYNKTRFYDVDNYEFYRETFNKLYSYVIKSISFDFKYDNIWGYDSSNLNIINWRSGFILYSFFNYKSSKFCFLFF